MTMFTTILQLDMNEKFYIYFLKMKWYVYYML